MLKSQRLATLPLDHYDLDSDLAIVDSCDAAGEYDAFTFGSWSALVLANGSGRESDTAFRPHEGALTVTELGRRLPTIMSVVTGHFATEHLQWVRIFRLSDGLLAPHVDFLEFEKAGTRLQIPLRTTESSLHSENDLVYHLRRGEVWKIHTADPHSALSAPGPARLSLCLDFSPAYQGTGIREAVADEPDIHMVTDRLPLSAADLEELLEWGAVMSPDTIRGTFRRFASLHFERQAHAADTFDWFVAAARRTGDQKLVHMAAAFRTYCLERRGYREVFSW